MTSRPRTRAKVLLRVLLAAGVILAIAFVARAYVQQNRDLESARSDLAKLDSLIPNERTNANVVPEGEHTPSPVINIDGRDYVGILEIPSLDVRLPIAASWRPESPRPGAYSGVLERGTLAIGGPNTAGQLGRLTETADGDRFTITDVTGRVFTFEVATIETVKSDEKAKILEKVEPWDVSLFADTFSGQEIRVLRGTAVPVFNDN